MTNYRLLYIDYILYMEGTRVSSFKWENICVRKYFTVNMIYYNYSYTDYLGCI